MCREVGDAHRLAVSSKATILYGPLHAHEPHVHFPALLGKRPATIDPSDDVDRPILLCDSVHCESKKTRNAKEAGQNSHPVTLINSRPISMRRISEVPAPISISLASRMIRLKGESFRKPAPPIACTPCTAISIAFSEA